MSHDSVVVVMDIVLDYSDHFFLNSVYPAHIPPDDWLRQLVSLLVIVNVGGFLMYLIPASLSYHLLFDKRHLNHPQILKVSQL